MKTEIEDAIKALVNKAKGAGSVGCDSTDALRYTQAALNLAHTAAVIDTNSRENNPQT